MNYILAPVRWVYGWVMAHKVAAVAIFLLLFFAGTALIAWSVEAIGKIVGRPIAERLANAPFLLAAPFFLFPLTWPVAWVITAAALMYKLGWVSKSDE